MEEILIRLGQLVTDFSEIQDIDINPLVIQGGQPVVVCASVRVGRPNRKAPMHLVISSYPNQYETKMTTKGGIDIFIRPIRPEDAPLLVALFEDLSPRSVYLRFFSPLKQLSRRMLARFTQIDYDREIALVALPTHPAEEKMLGVARLIVERNGKSAEFAVLTGDPCQGKGIGAELLGRCLNIAKERCIEHVWGAGAGREHQHACPGKETELFRQKNTRRGRIPIGEIPGSGLKTGISHAQQKMHDRADPEYHDRCSSLLQPVKFLDDNSLIHFPNRLI